MMSSLKLFSVYFNSFLYKTNRFQVAVRLFSDTLGSALCATFLFLPHFDVICDLLLNRSTGTWNLFVKSILLVLFFTHYSKIKRAAC